MLLTVCSCVCHRQASRAQACADRMAQAHFASVSAGSLESVVATFASGLAEAGSALAAADAAVAATARTVSSAVPVCSAASSRRTLTKYDEGLSAMASALASRDFADWSARERAVLLHELCEVAAASPIIGADIERRCSAGDTLRTCWFSSLALPPALCRRLTNRTPLPLCSRRLFG